VIEIREGCRFDFGGLTVDVFEFPAHTKGSIGFLDNKKRFFRGDSIGDKRWILQITELSLQTMVEVLEKIERLKEKWEGIWNGYFGQMNKVLGIDEVRRLKEFVKSIVEGNGNFEGKTDRDGKEFCKIDFVG
jgi:glyoxylase-like metal-dependent hydrolase (beta-lactamase superfamily II)